MRSFRTICLGALLIALFGCSILNRNGTVARQEGETVVLIGQEPAFFAHHPVGKDGVRARDAYLPQDAKNRWVEGRDYIIDPAIGSIRRTPGSRMPDFSTNMLFGKTNFSHGDYPGFGNRAFFAYVDYNYRAERPWPVQNNQSKYLQRTIARLRAGEALKIVAFGDSITAGGDVPKAELFFWQRWADALQTRYPNARVTAVNGATGGDNTVQGLARLDEKVLKEKPDLVLIGFGMNDHNVSGVTIENFETNLVEMIRRIRAETEAEVILFSAFPPNPYWRFGTHRMKEYADATSRVAQRTQCAYADVFSNWQAVAVGKKPEDLLANNINHPNEFGHWIYLKVFEKLF